MIAQKPYKMVCKYCGHKKIVRPKSDVVNPSDMMPLCPKCKGKMQRLELNSIDKFFIIWKVG